MSGSNWLKIRRNTVPEDDYEPNYYEIGYAKGLSDVKDQLSVLEAMRDGDEPYFKDGDRFEWRAILDRMMRSPL